MINIQYKHNNNKELIFIRKILKFLESNTLVNVRSVRVSERLAASTRGFCNNKVVYTIWKLTDNNLLNKIKIYNFM